MLRVTAPRHRLGMPKPPSRIMPDRWHLIAPARRPQQGGQQHFQQHMLEDANTAARQARLDAQRAREASSKHVPRMDARNPLLGLADERLASPQQLDAAVDALQDHDEFVSKRAFNERDALDEYRASRRMPKADEAAEAEAAEAAAEAIPEPVLGNDYFESTFGYSLVKNKSQLPKPDANFATYDLWAEQPRYNRGTYFLYLVARRRNAYAVIYDFAGKRMLPTYSSGNRGLKDSDKGFKSEGSSENAHIVTSQYLNDVLPKLKDAEIAAGRMKPGEKKRIELVVRVLGFYNARTGGVRALTDRQDDFDVRYFEDITPFPLNGPRMPKASPGP